MNAKVYLKDPKTNVTFYADNRRIFFYLNKGSVRAMPLSFISDLRIATEKLGYVWVKQTVKNYLVEFVTFSEDRKNEFVKQMIAFLSSKNFRDDGRTSGGRGGGRFTKKGFYSPTAKEGDYIEHDFGNGLILFEEKQENGELKFVLAITDEVDRIDYAKFKDFVLAIQSTDLGRGKEELAFNYQKPTQSFVLYSHLPYDTKAGTYGDFVEEVKLKTLRYYPLKTQITSATEPQEPQQPQEPPKQTPEEMKRMVFEEIESLEFAKGYLNPFSDKKQIEELESEIDTLKYLLTTLSQ